nr:hypothetical protein [Sphingobium sp. BS19]
MSTASRSMSSIRLATSHERASSFLNGISPIIKVPSTDDWHCMQGQRGATSECGAEGKFNGETWE